MDIKEVSNYLLRHCYIMGDVEETKEQYFYAINHLEEIRKLFSQLGYTIAFHPAPLKIIMLVNEYEGAQARLHVVESIFLLICRSLYIQKRERLNTDANKVIVTVDDILTEYQKLNRAKLTRPDLLDTVRVLKRYNLVRSLDKLTDGSSRIEIYPSVLLALPDNVLRASVEETEKELAKYGKNYEECNEEEDE